MPIINIAFSILLVNIIGLPGVILGTIISYLFLIIFSYPKYVFKPLFNIDGKYYFFDLIKYFFITVISLILSMTLCNMLPITNLVLIIATNLIIAFILVTLIFILFTKNTDEFKELLGIIKRILIKLKLVQS